MPPIKPLYNEESNWRHHPSRKMDEHGLSFIEVLPSRSHPSKLDIQICHFEAAWRHALASGPWRQSSSPHTRFFYVQKWVDELPKAKCIFPQHVNRLCSTHVRSHDRTTFHQNQRLLVEPAMQGHLSLYRSMTWESCGRFSIHSAR